MSHVEYYEDKADEIISLIESGDFESAQSMTDELGNYDFPSEIWDSIIQAFEDAGRPYDDSPF